MTKLLVIVSKLLAIALIVIAGFVTGFIPWQRAVSPQPVPSPTPEMVSPPTPSPEAEPVPSPSSTPIENPQIPQNEDIKFEFVVTDVSGSGLSRTITAQITNTGTADAHTVWAKVEAFSAGSRVKLSGQDFLRVDIGTMKAGEMVTRQVTLSFSIADGLKISSNGVRFMLNVYSDEHTESLSYDYHP